MLNKIYKYIYLLAFVIVAYLLLPMANGDYLYTIQDNSAFIMGKTFMRDTIESHGWVAWVSCYLTQFFYHPWLGSTILIALWAITYLLMLSTFQWHGKWCFLALLPNLFFLFWTLDYGYWIYYTKTVGFVFNHTLMFFILMLSTFLLKHIMLRFFIYRGKLKFTIPYHACLLCCAIGLPQLGPWHFGDHQSEFMVTMRNENFRHELKMYRAVEEGRYEDVINEMQLCKEAPTNLMVLFKNIALMHTNRLTDLFKTNNCGVMLETGDSLQVRISQLAAPLIYYQFGQFNYAYRWAMENNVQRRFSFRNLKMMTLCALFNQEFELAQKYITLLKATTFQRQWAIEHEAWLKNSTNFMQSKEFQQLQPLMNDDTNCLDDDEGLCENYLLDHFSNLRHAASPLLEDVILCTSLWKEDGYAFCIHFYDYVQNHPNATIPTLYQEGAILLGNMEESPITIDNFQFDAIVSEKYYRFAHDYNQLSQQGLSQEEMGKRLRPQYGDTYWWYYYFYTDFNIY